MRIVYFTHSLRSCWNHGNAHFLRGVLREFAGAGHEVRALEPEDAWSAANLVADHGPKALEAWREAYPELLAETYRPGSDPEALVDGADLVLVHEWNDPALVARLGRMSRRFVLLFHDTHHRAVSAPGEMERYDLSGYDGVLAFGEALAEVYRDRGWGNRAFVWHEAADTRLFRPPDVEDERQGIVFIGNWGDGERTAELETYLLAPSSRCDLPVTFHGVRYPPEALDLLARYGAFHAGWLPNHRAPDVFARHLATVHVPRRFYTRLLPGIPTIRVFEALACGIPLVCAPWDDSENLFRPGEDYLLGRDGEEMAGHLAALRDDPELRRSLARSGLETIRARHSCRHRAVELLAIAASLKPLPVTGGPSPKPLPFRGGVGVGPVPRSSPSADHPSIPSPEGKGRTYA